MGKYDSIISQIDAAIAAGISGPGQISDGEKSITYRDLKQLLELRRYYSSINSTGGISIKKITGGSIR